MLVVASDIARLVAFLVHRLYAMLTSYCEICIDLLIKPLARKSICLFPTVEGYFFEKIIILVEF